MNTTKMGRSTSSRLDEHFDERKRGIISALLTNGETPDKSRKGDVDEPIWGIINKLNAFNDYVTTSSCSGRSCVFYVDDTRKKWTGQWLYVTHGMIDRTDMKAAVHKAPQETKGLVLFRYESFLLHVQCRTLEHARTLCQIALACGYRNSGVVLGQKNTIVAIRGTPKLEVPLALNGELLVSDAYLDVLAELADSKQAENFSRINAFESTMEHDLLAAEEERRKQHELIVAKRIKAEKARRKAKPDVGTREEEEDDDIDNMNFDNIFL